MAYTTIDKPTDYFETVLYTGNGASTPSGSGSTQTISSLDFAPDWVWLKDRTQSGHNNNLADTVRGAPNLLFSDTNNAEVTDSTDGFTGFTSNGFTLGDNGEGTQSLELNKSGNSYVAWTWSAGGSAPAITYTVKVVSDGGNKYRFDDYGTSAVTLDLQEGGTYTFDLSDSSNDGHPMKFSETSNGSHGGGSTYSTGVVYQLDGASVTEANYYNTSNFNSASSRKIIITVSASAPTLYYFCHYHSGMGGQANTNSTHGSSNFSGSVQTTVSANTTAGFSICKFTYPSSGNFTFGHGLGVAPKMFILKGFSNSSALANWQVYHESLGNTFNTQLNYNSASNSGANWWNSTSPTSTVCTVGSDLVETSQDGIAYVFAEKKGYSKFGKYTGNGSADGTFVYTGFKPAMVILKYSSGSDNWYLKDNKRDVDNPVITQVFPNLTNADNTNSVSHLDFLSNGFKLRGTDSGINGSGGTYIYMAWAESSFVNSNGVPTNAR